MASINTAISVDLLKKSPQKAVLAKQNDANSRFLDITVLKDGAVFNVPPDTTVTLNVLKPDGTHTMTSATVNANGTVTAELTSQTLAAEGRAECELTLISANPTRELTTMTFYVDVQPALRDDDDIASSDEYSALTTLLAEVQEMKDDLDDYTDAASESATSASGSASAAATSATNAAAAAKSAVQATTVEASGLAAGATPTVEASNTANGIKLSFGIPAGAKGDTGAGVPESGGSVGDVLKKTAGGTEWDALGALAAKSTVDTDDITNGAVTLAKQANIASCTILGNNGANASAPAALNPAQVRETIGAASNKNLIGNPDFSINQRGYTTYIAGTGTDTSTTHYVGGSGYTLDMWKITYSSGDSTVTVANDSINLTTAGMLQLDQYIVNPSRLAGRTLTLSVKIKAITTGKLILRAKINDSAISGTWKAVTTTGITSTLIPVPSTITDSDRFCVELWCDAAANIDVCAAKLELGGVSTLANDPPADYAAELAKCQRYYYQSWTGAVSSSMNGGIARQAITDARLCDVELPMEMRAAPDITFYTADGQQGKCKEWTTDAVVSGLGTVYKNNKKFFPAAPASSFVAGKFYAFNYCANIEL